MVLFFNAGTIQWFHTCPLFIVMHAFPLLSVNKLCNKNDFIQCFIWIEFLWTCYHFVLFRVFRTPLKYGQLDLVISSRKCLSRLLALIEIKYCMHARFLINHLTLAWGHAWKNNRVSFICVAACKIRNFSNTNHSKLPTYSLQHFWLQRTSIHYSVVLIRWTGWCNTGIINISALKKVCRLVRTIINSCNMDMLHKCVCTFIILHYTHYETKSALF